jgi:hypothetical protein
MLCKFIVIAKLDWASNTITIQRFEEQPGQAGQGATSTRPSTSLQPLMMQEITSTRTATNLVNFNITSGDLILPFMRLFHRTPSRQEPEDVVISVAQLRDYAGTVWLSEPQ